MTLAARRWLMLALTLFFLALAPISILYSLGYKYNPQKIRLERTGIFYVKSYPKSADVYLNDKKQKVKTPGRITRLLPNIYKVMIAKDGFRPWTKNLAIDPQLTTFIEDVSLFKENLAWENLAQGDFKELTISPNRYYNAFVKTEENGANSLMLLTLSNQEIKILYSSKSKNELDLIGWSLSSKKILFKEANDYLVVNAETPNGLHGVYDIFSQRYTDLAFSDTNDNILYGLRQNRLYELDLGQKKETLLEAGPVLAFEPYFNKVILIEKTAEAFFLSSRENGKTTRLFKLPASNDYQLQANSSSYLPLLDKEQGMLYLLEPENQSEPINAIFKDTLGYNWLDKQIVYWTPSELWVYYPESKQKILLERTSQKISFGFFHPNRAYVYGVIGDELKVYELDGRDLRNNYSLLKLSPDFKNNLATDDKGQHLYIIDSNQNQPGFYRIEIQ